MREESKEGGREGGREEGRNMDGQEWVVLAGACEMQKQLTISNFRLSSFTNCGTLKTVSLIAVKTLQSEGHYKLITKLKVDLRTT